ncbi:hypothetical protein ACHQM5_016478 [Ranunculus cassubicifolius]
MALEDFLTLSEISNGLSAIDRVEELVSVMKKEKNCTVKNAGEAASKWSIVGRMLAATKSMVVVQHFMQLGGLEFLAQWLREALQYSKDHNESSVEESTCDLLRALEKLPMDKEMTIFSEIMASVKALAGHNSPRVQESAKTLFERLDRGKAEECNLVDVEKDVGFHDNAKPLETRGAIASSSLEHSAVNASPVKAAADKDKVAVIQGIELQHPRSSDCSQSESVAAVEIPVPEKPVSYTASSQVDDNEVSHVYSSSGADHNSSVDTHAQHSVTEPAVEDHVDDKKSEFCVGKLSTNVDSNTSTVVSNPSDVAVDLGLPKHFESEVNIKTSDNDDGGLSRIENSKTSFSGEINDVKEFAVESTMKMEGTEHSATTGENLTADEKNSEDVGMSRVDPAFVEDDALEVARRVTKEVELEVVHYREPVCSSSSKKNSVGRAVQPRSPDSVNCEQDHPMTEPQDEILAEQNIIRGAIPLTAVEDRISLKNNDSFKVTETAQVPAHEKKTPTFDLNEESYSQETDQQRVIVSPINAAPTLKAAELESMGAPCHVEVKAKPSEYAKTSAFRPVPIVRSPDAEKAFSVEGSSNSKQRQDFLDIDLNVAEGNNATDTVVAKLLASSGLPSGESSVEVSSKRAKTAKWDLNDMVDMEDRSPSPMMSSSSKQPTMRNLDLNDNPSQYGYLGPQSDQGASSSQGHSEVKSDDPYVSIMGMKVLISREEASIKVPISREEAIPRVETRSFLPIRPFPSSPSSGTNYTQSDGAAGTHYPMAYVPSSSGFGYNGLQIDPFMPHSPALYGTPSIPSLGLQVMGAPLAVRPSITVPHFPVGTSTSPAGYNWIGPSQPNLDLNSGLFMSEVGTREQGGSRHYGDVNMTMDLMGSTSQTMNSGMRFKRMEPDNGNETYLGAYKRQQPPWH